MNPIIDAVAQERWWRVTVDGTHERSVLAPTRGRARMEVVYDLLDVCDGTVRELLPRVHVRAGGSDPLVPARATVAAWNEKHPVGTPVRHWTWLRGVGPGVESRTRSTAQMLGGHRPVVWVEGHASCIALTHVEVICGQ